MRSMQTLRVFSNPHQAEILRTRLDAEGILAVINGGEVATMLSHIGTAVAKVRLEVAPEDFQRAVAVLEEDDLQRAELTPWQCSRCDERNEASFELCWNCGKSRGDCDGEPVQSESTGKPTETSVVLDETLIPRPFSTNPYAPVLISADGQTDQRVHDEPDEELVSAVSRVFAGAIFSPIVLPPVLAVYNLYLLLFRVPRRAYHYRRLRLRLFASWILIPISFFFAGALFIM
ncbi:MAG: DUF2007 domain-containing protein [Pirellulaceae bacterium]|nr:DUF2007 domain-containing protein [Pirellulaceae bacterium]